MLSVLMGEWGKHAMGYQWRPKDSSVCSPSTWALAAELGLSCLHGCFYPLNISLPEFRVRFSLLSTKDSSSV